MWACHMTENTAGCNSLTVLQIDICLLTSLLPLFLVIRSQWSCSSILIMEVVGDQFIENVDRIHLFVYSTKWNIYAAIKCT